MGTLAISMQVPPIGVLETSGDGSNPTDEQMAEESAARDKILKILLPFLDSLPKRPPRRSGNVTGFDLLGAKVWSRLNHYLLLLEIDIADNQVPDELSKLLPQRSQISVLGEFESLSSRT
jgi:hypothetical protein